MSQDPRVLSRLEPKIEMHQKIEFQIIFLSRLLPMRCWIIGCSLSLRSLYEARLEVVCKSAAIMWLLAGFG
jgi:hypothetical protein